MGRDEFDRDCRRSVRIENLRGIISAHIAMMVRPGKKLTLQNYSDKFPMTVEDWTALFPNTRKCKPKEPEISMNNPARNAYAHRRKLFSLDVHQPEALQDVFGDEWYFIHEADCVGVILKVNLSLWNHTTTQYRTNSKPDIIPGTIRQQSVTYLHIGFKMRSIKHATVVDREGLNWKKRAEDVIEQYNTK